VSEDANGDGGSAGDLSCTYTPAGGSAANVCALLIDAMDTDGSIAATCTTSQSEGGLGGQTSTGCSSLQGLLGCCELPGGTNDSFGAPTWTCYGTGSAETSATCSAAGGMWSATSPD
jgi:hypothetical protein